jgi:hypothetical protein
MRISRLIPIIVVLFILGAITMTSFQRRLFGVKSGTASAQKAIVFDGEPAPGPSQSDGTSSFVAADTTVQQDTDLYLDADEVEKIAAQEQADSSFTTSGRVPVSFRAVPIPLPGGIDHAVAGVGTRNSGTGVIRLRGVPPGSTLLSALLIWGEITPPPALGYNIGFGPDCAAGGNFASAGLWYDCTTVLESKRACTRVTLSTSRPRFFRVSTATIGLKG